MAKCFFCGNIYIDNAGMHITEINKGEVTTFHVCLKCGRSYLESPEGNSTTIPMEDVKVIDVEIEEDKPKKATVNKKCSKCGLTLAQLRKTGRLGCKNCYEVFDEEIKAIVNVCQSSDLHIGKRPQKRGFDEHIKELKLKRAKAIELEQYEVAGEITKQLKDLGVEN